MSNAIVTLDDVSFSFAGTDDRAIEHVSLSIEPGEFVGIVGPAGSGKSTIAAVMSGAIPHHFGGQFFGAAIVDGQDTCEVSLTDISRLVGSVLQDIDAQMVASEVEDELLFGLENFGVPHDQVEQRLEEALATVGISDLRYRQIATLSGGQKQKVAIAAILALRPRVLVLDEPTAALDPASSELVFKTLAQIRQSEGIAVVVIEQKVALLSRFCSRVVVVSEGRVAFDGTPSKVFSHATELRELGVDSPRVTRVGHSLAQKGLASGTAPCLTVADAHDLVASLVAPAGKKSRPLAASAPIAKAARPASTSPEPVVSFDHVNFSYATGAAVSDLTLEVRPGEMVGIVGQNGAGKTTLTKLLCGLLHPASGQVRVSGLVTSDTPTSKIAAHVATLFQNPDRQICKETVLDEVAFGLELQGVPADKARERARVAAERFGLPLDESPFSLSRGERQMVALASVVVMEPDVVLLDEPTSGLDYRECMTVMRTVRQMAERGCAVVMVCHDMEVVLDFAERIVVMADGRILADGPAHELFADSDLMRRASVEAPQAIQLAQALAADVCDAYAPMTEVAEIVDLTVELAKEAGRD